MRIMHTILSRGFAGSERSTAESCNQQARLGHEVMLIVQRRHRGRAGATILDYIDPAVAVREVPSRLFTRRAIGAAIDAFRPDVIHTHLRRSTRLVVALRPQAATVATLHLSINGPQYLQLDGLFCNAYWQCREVPDDYRGTVFKMHNSLLPHRRLDEGERQAIRRELGVGEHGFLVGGVGRLARSKGWDTLIAAFERARLADARLVIFGEGRERAKLEAMAGAHVSLPGHRRDIKDLYQAFDVFVCPSRREPLPRVMLEAMDGGTPVIGSTADGCRELVDDYGGDLFPVEDVDALAALLQRHHRERVGRRDVDLSRHHIERVTLDYLDAYQTLIERKRGAAEQAAA